MNSSLSETKITEIPSELMFPGFEQCVNQFGHTPLMCWIEYHQDDDVIPKELFYPNCEKHLDNDGYSPLGCWLIAHGFQYSTAPEQIVYEDWQNDPNMIQLFKDHIIVRVYNFFERDGSIRRHKQISHKQCCLCHNENRVCLPLSLKEPLWEQLKDPTKESSDEKTQLNEFFEKMEMFVCVDCLKEISATNEHLKQLWLRNNTYDAGQTAIDDAAQNNIDDAPPTIDDSQTDIDDER